MFSWCPHVHTNYLTNHTSTEYNNNFITGNISLIRRLGDHTHSLFPPTALCWTSYIDTNNARNPSRSSRRHRLAKHNKFVTCLVSQSLESCAFYIPTKLYQKCAVKSRVHIFFLYMKLYNYISCINNLPY